MNQPPTNIDNAVESKLNPVKDALFIENANSPEVKKFIEEKYKGAIVPCSDSSAFSLTAMERSPKLTLVGILC